jgi:hypothetical protein
MLGAKLVEFSADRELVAVKEKDLKADAFTDYISSSHHGYFVGAGMSVLQRDAFLKTGGYTERRINAEDHDLILRMGTARGFVQITSPVTLGWRRHPGNATMNLHHAFDGIFYLLEQERRAAYPGGMTRAKERWRILTRHVRSATIEGVRAGAVKEAWVLYRSTFRWNLHLHRWRYLAAFPLLTAVARVRANRDLVRP